MTNYSKWDKFASELSDEEYEDDNFKPQVTTFDKEGGESITIGPSGYHVKSSEPVHSQSMDRTTSPVENKKDPIVEVLNSCVQLTEHDLCVESRNGAVLSRFSWCQDRHEVILSIPIDESIRAKDIKISFENKELTIMSRNSVIIKEQLRYDILTNLDDRKNDEVSDILDWEIKNKIDSNNPSRNRRVLEVVMRKKSPFQGVFLWWENVFLSDSVKIDVTKVSGRVNSIDAIKSATDNYVEANKQFMEKIAKHEPIEVDYDD